MSHGQRAAVVSVIEEIYALVGRLLATRVPLGVGAVRPEVVERISALPDFRLPTDPGNLRLLQQRYVDAFDAMLQIQEALLDESADRADADVSDDGTADRNEAVAMFRDGLGKLLAADERGIDAEQIGQVIARARSVYQPVVSELRVADMAQPITSLVVVVQSELT